LGDRQARHASVTERKGGRTGGVVGSRRGWPRPSRWRGPSGDSPTSLAGDVLSPRRSTSWREVSPNPLLRLIL
jgi:hypothetical protein